MITMIKREVVKFCLVISILSIFQIGCANSSEPIIENVQPGRRDYTWKVDTIKLGPITYFTRLWGSSPNDVWVVGIGEMAETMWHYDGVKWTPYNKNLSTSFMGIYGFGEKEIFAGDEDGFIYKYDGEWNKLQRLTIEGYNYSIIDRIWGLSSSDLYAVGSVWSSNDSIGYKGAVWHYDGKTWKNLNLPHIKNVYTNIQVQQSTGNIFLEDIKKEPGFPEAAYIYQNNSLTKLCSAFNSINIRSLNDEIYIQNEKLIYKYKNNKLVLWKDFTGTIYETNLFLRNEKDMIGGAGTGQLVHYNGDNWEIIFEKKNYWMCGWLFLEKDIFIIGQDDFTNESFIVRGTLKDKE